MKNKTCGECKHLNRELAFCRACGAKWLKDSDGANCQYFEQKTPATNGDVIRQKARQGKMSNEQRERWNKNRRERYAADPEYRKKHKIATEKWYQKKCAADPEYREKHLAYMREYARKYRQKKNPTLFKQITSSSQVLAEKLVYQFIAYDRDGLFVSHWRSTLTGDKEYLSKPEAVVVTIKELEKAIK